MEEFVIAPVLEWMVAHCSVAEGVTKQGLEMWKGNAIADSYGVVMWYVINADLERKNIYATKSIH